MPSTFWKVPDEVWTHVWPFVPEPRGTEAAARKRLEAMVFQMKTRCRWDALPAQFGDGAKLEALHAVWAAAGVFDMLFFALLHAADGASDDLLWCRPAGAQAVLGERRVDRDHGLYALMHAAHAALMH